MQLEAIAASVGTRNHMQCLQRWKKVLKPGITKGNWSLHEDVTLLHLVGSGGREDWSRIAALLPSRSARECRERWHYYLTPLIERAGVHAEPVAPGLLDGRRDIRDLFAPSPQHAAAAAAAAAACPAGSTARAWGPTCSGC